MKSTSHDTPPLHVTRRVHPSQDVPVFFFHNLKRPPPAALAGKSFDSVSSQVVQVISVIGTAAADEEIAVGSITPSPPSRRRGMIFSVSTYWNIGLGKTAYTWRVKPTSLGRWVRIAVLARIGARNEQVTHTGRPHCGERSEALMYYGN
jgi:hypothetical protein